MTLTDFGFTPTHSYAGFFPLIAIGLWLLFLPIAYFKKVRIFYNASVKAAFLEEIIFRGLVYGAVLYFGYGPIYAIVISSLVFGLVHMRNFWWAGWSRAWKMTLYAGLTGGPLFGIVRFLTGDIYLGILVHFLHNFLIIFAPGGLKRYVAPVPTDHEMANARQRARHSH